MVKDLLVVKGIRAGRVQSRARGSSRPPFIVSSRERCSEELTEEEAGMQVASEYPLSCWRCGFQSSSCKLPKQLLGNRCASTFEGCLMLE